MWRLLLALAVLAIPAGALWRGGAFDRHEAEPATTVRIVQPEEAHAVWARRVGTICKWERRQQRTIVREYGRMYTLQEVEGFLAEMIQIGDESAGILTRLHPPIQERWDVRELVGVVRGRQQAAKEMLAAIEAQELRQFRSSEYRFLVLSKRRWEILQRVGASGCVPRAHVVLPDRRRALV
jgi:hypothetical protein